MFILKESLMEVVKDYFLIIQENGVSKLIPQKKSLLKILGTFYGFKIVLKIIKLRRQFVKERSFFENYGTDSSLGSLGLLPKLKELLSNDEDYLKWREGKSFYFLY